MVQGTKKQEFTGNPQGARGYASLVVECSTVMIWYHVVPYGNVNQSNTSSTSCCSALLRLFQEAKCKLRHCSTMKFMSTTSFDNAS